MHIVISVGGAVLIVGGVATAAYVKGHVDGQKSMEDPEVQRALAKAELIKMLSKLEGEEAAIALETEDEAVSRLFHRRTKVKVG